MQTTSVYSTTSFLVGNSEDSQRNHLGRQHPFRQVDKDTQAILDTDVDCLIDCDDVSLGSNASSFIAAEDDESIGSFLSTTNNKVTFSPTNKVRTFDSTETWDTPPTTIYISNSAISPQEQSTFTSESASAKESANPLASG